MNRNLYPVLTKSYFSRNANNNIQHYSQHHTANQNPQWNPPHPHMHMQSFTRQPMHPFGFGIPPSDPRFHQVDTSTDHFKIKLAQSPNPDGSVEIRVDKDKVSVPPIVSLIILKRIMVFI